MVEGYFVQAGLEDFRRIYSRKKLEKRNILVEKMFNLYFFKGKFYKNGYFASHLGLKSRTPKKCQLHVNAHFLPCN